MKRSEFTSLLRETYTEWTEDKAPRLGAALAYYTVFSMAPVLIILVSVAGAVWGNQSDVVQARVLNEISRSIGPGGAQMIEELLSSSSRSSGGTLATVLGIFAMLFGATTVFAQLQDALNTIWEVRSTASGIRGLIGTRLLSFGVILLVGFLLLCLLAASVLLSALDTFLADLTTGIHLLIRALDLLLSIGLLTLLFAMTYRYLPDVEIAWREVWVGSAITAALFTLGRYALGAYLANSGMGSAYGAAGSLVVLLVWVYYSAQIFFFGAEFTQVYARRYGTRIQPSAHAERIVEGEAHRAPSIPPSPSPVSSPSTPRWKRAVPVVLAFLIGRLLGGRR